MIIALDEKVSTLDSDSRHLSTTTLGTLDERATQNTLAWNLLLLEPVNASDLTLVPKSGSCSGCGEPGVFVYSQDSMFNTTIFNGNLSDPNSRPVYRLRTNARGMRTDVWHIREEDGMEEELCGYDRRLLGSVILWPNGEKTKTSKYIRPSKSKPEGARHAAVFDYDGITYEWRIDIMGKIACYVEGSPMVDPIAWFNRSKRMLDEHRKPIIRSAAMGMKAEVASYRPLRDQILITWILISEKARTWPYNVTSA